MKPHPRLDFTVFPVPKRVAIDAGRTAITSELEATERVDPDAVGEPEGYRLTVDADGIELVGHDPAGLCYGRETLRQLMRRCPSGVPQLVIEDWPDLPVRGYMLDISRDRVPQLPWLKGLIDRLASLKLNQLQIYTEHTLAFEGHSSAWKDASPLTFAEWGEIEGYCKERFIDLVPCQNVFGHMERWLTKPEYAGLAECPEGWDTPWGFRDPNPFSLDPSDPGSFELSADLIDQLAASSSSELFNIGCDETLDLGQGKNEAVVKERGRASVYLDYLKKLCDRVSQHGKRPMFWGDIVLEHPELVPQVPGNAILLNWGYEANHPFDEQSRQFVEAGVPFYVCTGTSTWCTLTGRNQNAIDNLLAGAEAAVEHGAEGYLITDWGDYGHWQPFTLSWIGLVYGAGVAWGLEQNRGVESLPSVVSRLAAGENNAALGELLRDVGNIYQASEAQPFNGTWWFQFLRTPGVKDAVKSLQQVSIGDARSVRSALEAAAAKVEAYEPTTSEGTQAKADLLWCIEVSHWVCGRIQGITVAGGPLATDEEFERLVARFRVLWAENSRPGGLKDSVRKLTEVLRADDCFSVQETPEFAGTP